MWPAIVVDESVIRNRKGLNKISKEKSLPVQFFGSHDFARSVMIEFIFILWIRLCAISLFLQPDAIISFNYIGLKLNRLLRFLRDFSLLST